MSTPQRHYSLETVDIDPQTGKIIGDNAANDHSTSQPTTSQAQSTAPAPISSTNSPKPEMTYPLPSHAVADFCLVPIGTPTASVSKEIAAVQRLLQQSGLDFKMHSAGTTVEGTWTECMNVIGQAHAMLHKNGVVRIQSDIRVGTRIDKHQTFEDKVSAVERILASAPME